MVVRQDWIGKMNYPLPYFRKHLKLNPWLNAFTISWLGSASANIDGHTFYELNKDDFDRLSIVFRNVFPGIYYALEKKWNYDIKYVTDWLEYKEVPHQELRCNHEWERTSIYKMGIYYFCLKCHNFISEVSMKYRRKMKGK
jgi:hypothetical protein